MKKATFPGFTAELSLYETSSHYVKAIQNSDVLIGSAKVMPQLISEWSELSCSGCITDRSHPNFGHVVCRRHRINTERIFDIGDILTFQWLEAGPIESSSICIAHPNSW